MARKSDARDTLLDQLAEVFRARGYDAASLAVIGAATGLGKGSLYHHFPGGKAEMLDQVLARIGAWFETRIFAPLRGSDGGDAAMSAMFGAVTDYFRSGRRVCLVGVIALNDACDPFAGRVRDYFAAWVAALAHALERAGHGAGARARAEATIAGIQGAIVLARALGDPSVFDRTIGILHGRLAVSCPA